MASSTTWFKEWSVTILIHWLFLQSVDVPYQKFLSPATLCFGTQGMFWTWGFCVGHSRPKSEAPLCVVWLRVGRKRMHQVSEHTELLCSTYFVWGQIGKSGKLCPIDWCDSVKRTPVSSVSTIRPKSCGASRWLCLFPGQVRSPRLKPVFQAWWGVFICAATPGWCQWSLMRCDRWWIFQGDRRRSGGPGEQRGKKREKIWRDTKEYSTPLRNKFSWQVERTYQRSKIE